MNKAKITTLVAVLLVLPAVALANVDASFNLNGVYTSGNDSQFDVLLKNYQVASNTLSVLAFSDSKVSDIKSAMFLDKSGWVKLTPYQSGNDVLAKFTADTGFDGANGRTISLRTNFSTPKTYIVGFSLENSSTGSVLSSTAAPLLVSGKVLGESITAPTNGAFTRPLRSGMKGDDVALLQNILTVAGFYSGPVTGYYGLQTRTAVKNYQVAHGIAGANGVVGPATLSALNQ